MAKPIHERYPNLISQAHVDKRAAAVHRNRHDAVAKPTHQELSLKYQLTYEARVPHYAYNPETVLENNSAVVTQKDSLRQNSSLLPT
ncbi:Protein of unknown function [Gryllus bimaculatus]|nr:Protein of unknown function [Gryllus bimaculatus]